MNIYNICFFFFSSRRRHTRCYRDWSSDVCSSDLRFLDSADTRTPKSGNEAEEPMTTVVANAVAHGGLNLPGRFQLPRRTVRTRRPGRPTRRRPAPAESWNVTPKPATPHPRRPKAPSWNVTPKPQVAVGTALVATRGRT